MKNYKSPKPKKCKWSKCGKMFTPDRPLQSVCNYVCATGIAKEKQAIKQAKDINEKVKAMKVDTHAKEHKSDLQAEINKLARKIDLKHGYFTCIDCDKEYGKQTDAAHFYSRGANSTLRYHLDNLHSANSQCNRFSDLHHTNYEKGLIKRYGVEYFKKVESLLLKYKSIHLTNQDITDKLKIVRLLNRTLHTYQFESAIEEREYFNKIIGIYQ